VSRGGSPFRKARLAADIWVAYVYVRRNLTRRPLPDLVRELSAEGRPVPQVVNPPRLGRAVFKSLGIGDVRARCISMALVHYHLLRRSGVDAELVIGLEHEPTSKDAHAWVEVQGRDVGPPPGRGDHQEMVRYP